MHYIDVDKDRKVKLSQFQRRYLKYRFHNGEQLCRYINEMWQQGKVVYVAGSPFNAVEDKKMLIGSASEFAFNRELARQKDDFNFQMHKALHEANWEYEHETDD
ncbi:hypothetical protein phiAS5_ORF0302 [Aeromonas phage phiAS5]|uniref:Uncharacterized protein n=1 Tax=Aeromonas phage phiAS5 TaxID=879630 RepID=E1A256_9CAUD|nr:hypothetical protein phiAS5_ORF0302 [Aeromonas phage phiAS5]ADM80145.1 hypothetical protein phiAS5_ORF0302 [Aeromonas phage phiAS5]BES53093.1 hypothetical protein [Aeromonas phage phiWae14]